MWCIDFSGYTHDPEGLAREIAVAEDVVRNYPPDSVLVAVNLYNAALPEPVIAFFIRNAASSSIQKMAVIGFSGLRRLWYEKVRHIRWPRVVRFFDDYEQAKKWLVTER
jgi:hypothetical protein